MNKEWSYDLKQFQSKKTNLIYWTFEFYNLQNHRVITGRIDKDCSMDDAFNIACKHFLKVTGFMFFKMAS